MRKKEQFYHPRSISVEKNRNPVLPEDGDEIYCNGIFRFNVSAMLDWLAQNPLPVVEIPVRLWETPSDVEDRYVNAADITRPIVIVEMAPDYRDFIADIPESDWLTRGYVCVDGHHRLEKAKRLGLQTLPAVVLRMEQHYPFLYAGNDQYVEYWNGKLKDRTEDAHRQR